MDAPALFKFVEADDADGLMAALAGTAEPHRVRNVGGESLFQFAIYCGRTKCAAAISQSGLLGLHEAALAGDAKRVEALIDAAPWAIDLLSPDGWTALHLAAFLGCDDVVVRLLKRGADACVWARAFETNLPIHAACAGRRIGRDALSQLVAATGDPDIRAKGGHTALMEAAGGGFTEAVEVLLAAGADRSLRHPEKNMVAAEFAQAQGHSALAERLR